MLPKKPRKKRMEPVQILSQGPVEVIEFVPKIPGLTIDAEPPPPRGGYRADQSEAFPLTPCPNMSAVDDNPVKSTNTDKPIRTLFVQCMPLQSNVRFAHDMIAKAAQTVENDLELHHVLLAPYSTGGASLAAQLRNDILSSGESGYDLVLMNRTPEARAVEQTLASLAQFVVVGL